MHVPVVSGTFCLECGDATVKVLRYRHEGGGRKFQARRVGNLEHQMICNTSIRWLSKGW